ncbi:MAG: hypothetical protein WCW66_05995 [Patescibacteria group bacterium]|jgi:hypothetical protein
MSAEGLSTSILRVLINRLDRGENVIRARISQIRGGNPSLTLNAAAYLYGKGNNVNVAGKLKQTDRDSLQGEQKDKIVSKITKEKVRRKKEKDFLSFDSKNKFAQKHIEEINRAYNGKCFTAVYVLIRKLIENYIIDILIKKFPQKNKENKKLYYNTDKKRFLDFSVILKNLLDKKNSFPVTCIKPIDRLYNLAKKFSKEANDLTHSWYYIATKTEIDEAKTDEIFDLIFIILEEIEK